ncbi:MAG: TIGR03960 family B12-binding radical SAM protein [Pseudomonadota bacterium]
MSRGVDELVRLGVRMPARYVGGEYFAEPPPLPQPGELKVALVFPDAYEVGMSNAGLAILYSMLRRTPGIFVDRFFVPWIDMEEHIRAGRATFDSRDHGLPLGDFDVVGVSLPFELTYTGILTVLDLGGIPLRAADRGPTGPLVIAGGPGAAHPEPVAPFFDAILVGDGEVLLPDFLTALREMDFPTGDRGGLLPGLDLLPGVYVPALHPTVTDATTGLEIVPGTVARRQWLEDLDQGPDLRPFPVPSVEAIFDRVSLEIARGCPQGCRFCEAGVYYRPFRERSTAGLLDEVRERVADTGMEEVGLASLSTADRTDLVGLVTSLRPILADSHASLSVSSLRAYGVGEEVLKVMAEGRTSSLTLAPESGSRLRGTINKNVKDQDLFDAVDRMCRAGWDRVKLYFMLGLPGETDDDVLEIARLAREVLAIGSRIRRARFQLVVSCSLFVPRPHTPLQWCGMTSSSALAAKIDLIRERLPRSVNLKWHDPTISRLEAIIARGDRAVAGLIEDAWRRGARLDGWSEIFDKGIWAEAEAATLPDPERYLGAMAQDAVLPWDHVDTGVTKGWLQKEWRRAEAGEMTPACDPHGEESACSACGLPCMTMKTGRESGPEGPPTARGVGGTGGELVLARVHFRRLPPSNVLGHLDLQRSLVRGLRRAGYPMVYTKGYHPRLKSSMGPSLALGAWGLDEWIEATFLDAPVEGWDAMVTKLQGVMIDGIEILRVVPRDGSKAKAPRTFEWLLRLARPVDPTALPEALARWKAGFEVERKGRMKDVSAAILDASVPTPEQIPAVVPAAPGFLRLILSAEASPRGEEIAADLGYAGAEVLSVIRVGSLGPAAKKVDRTESAEAPWPEGAGVHADRRRT